MATSHVFSSQQEFEKHCAANDSKVLLTHNNIVYDVTEFLDSHPGGPAFILDYQSKDITEIFNDDDLHDHSTNALRMMYKYKIGSIQPQGEKSEKKTDEVESYPRITKDKLEYNEFSIDLNKGMVPQVLNLNKKQYMHMIHYPVHLPYCRLFDSDWAESLSRNPWYRIPIIWIPIVCYLLYNGMTYNYEEHSSFDNYILIGSPAFSVFAIILTFLSGVFIWTLVEYGLHRGVFHFDDPLPDNKWAIWLHFIIHGIHHTIPMDPDRLVFPPVLGAAVYSTLFPLGIWLVPGNLGRIWIAGVLLGYICYDMVHIYIHHCSPWIGHLKEMKNFHNKHHYIDGNRAFGITVKLWDRVFRTNLE